MNRSPVSDATGRIDRRRRFTRRHRLLAAAVAAVVLTLIGSLVWLVGFSDVLAVRSVDVQGVQVLTADEVRAVAAVPNGQSMVWIDPGSVATRVSGLAAVAQVSVVRVWPHSLLVRVTERRPLYALESGTGYLMVDAAGVPFQAVLERPKAVVVQAPADSQRLLKDIATVLAGLDNGLRERVERVSATSPDTITLQLSGGVEVLWGSVDQSPLKLQVLEGLMQLRQARHYDVSAPSNPTTK